MAAHRESKFGLPRAGSVRSGDDQRRGVQNGGKRREPRLIAMLRTKIGDDRIRDVALEQLGGPSFPILEQNLNGLNAVLAAVARQQFGGGGRRTGARVEQHDADFALGESLINDRQVADDQSEKSEAESALEDGHDPFAGSVRSDITQT